MLDPARHIDRKVPRLPSFSSLSKGKGKRERTRAQLIDAAAALIAQGGIESATISEITASAGMAAGTFYNHFNDRAEIIAETATSIMEAVSEKIHQAGEDEDNYAIKLASGTRRFIYFVNTHPDWALTVLRSIDHLPTLRPRVYRYIGDTVRKGCDAGYFSQADDFTIYILTSMLFAAARGLLQGTESDEDIGSRIAEMQLLLLGVNKKLARKAAHQTISTLNFL